MSILTTLLGKVCVLSTRLSSSSKGTEIILLYIILPCFIEISQEFFEIIDINNQTHRHIHADENNTCQKTKFLGQVTIVIKVFCDKKMKTFLKQSRVFFFLFYYDFTYNSTEFSRRCQLSRFCGN